MFTLSPVPSVIAPLAPAVPESGVEIVTAPLDVSADAPDETDTLPPAEEAPVAEAPAEIVRAAPTPEPVPQHL